MVTEKIREFFSHHLRKLKIIDKSLYIADYTEHTKNCSNKKSIELFDYQPNDIPYFMIENSCNLKINCIPFDNNSFTRPNGSSLSQCECVIYPNQNNDNSWILFLELKYTSNCRNNRKNLNKARLQLFKTQYYYKSKGIFNNKNTCYLIASLPMQQPPFANISLPQWYLSNMKSKHNVVIRFLNFVKVIDNKELQV